MLLNRRAYIILAGFWFIALTTNAVSLQVWDEQAFSRLRVGINPENRLSTYRVMVLGAVGPDAPIATVGAEKTCVNDSLKKSVEVITTSLDDDVYPFSSIEDRLSKAKKEVNPTNVEGEVRLLSDRIVEIMRRGQDEFKYRLRICLKDQSIRNSFRIGVVARVCENNFSNCETSQLGKQDRFEKLVEWTGRGSPPIVVNRWKFIGDGGLPIDQDPNLIEMNPSGSMWPPEPSAQTLMTQFERLLLDGKKKGSGITISYAAAPMMKLSLTQGRQVLLALNASGRALTLLSQKVDTIQVVKFSSEQGAPVKARLDTIQRPVSSFSDWSDEVAKVRIKECVKFRGISDMTGIGNCAGYNLAGADGAKTVTSCLTSDRCLAEPTGQAFASVATLIRYDLDKETQRGLAVPRIAQTKLADLQKNLKSCYDQHPNDPTAATLCLVELGAPDENKKTMECLKSGPKSESARAKCLFEAVGDKAALNKAKCILDSANSRQALSCATASLMPPAVRDSLACFSDVSQNKGIDAFTKCIPRQTDDQRVALRCLNEHKSDWSSAFSCYAGTKVNDPAVKASLECASSNGSTMTGFAGCMAGRNLPKIPGDVGKFVTCAAANGGVGLGTSSCMAGDKLTPEQRILLQCASQAAGGPSYAVCVGGMLAFKEFTQCRDRKIGSGPCFGENNEIRKFFRNVFGQDIHEDTVVGQVLNVPLEVVKFATKPHTIATVGGARVCFPWC
jgi:hypothetical protein